MAEVQRSRAEAIRLIVKISNALGDPNDWTPEALEVLKAWFVGCAEGSNREH